MRAAGIAAAAAPIAVAAMLAAAGCGDDPGPGGDPAAAPAPPPKLSASERRDVAAYERRISAHCVRVSRSLVDADEAPTRRQEAAAFAAADELVALAAAKPTAPYGPGQDLRLFVSDVVENLEGSNCDPRMIARLEQGLAGIPVS